MSSYFPMSGFRATACAPTVDNRYDFAPNTWVTVPLPDGEMQLRGLR